VIEDQSRFKELSIAFKELEETVETYKLYKKVSEDLEEAMRWIESKDPDLKMMGEEEMEKLEKIGGVRKEVKIATSPKRPL